MYRADRALLDEMYTARYRADWTDVQKQRYSSLIVDCSQN